jgi:hypothetical protein
MVNTTTMALTYKSEPENQLTAVQAREIRRLPVIACWDRLVLAIRGIATAGWPCRVGIMPDEPITFGDIGEDAKSRFGSNFLLYRRRRVLLR